MAQLISKEISTSRPAIGKMRKSIVVSNVGENTTSFDVCDIAAGQHIGGIRFSVDMPDAEEPSQTDFDVHVRYCKSNSLEVPIEMLRAPQNETAAMDRLSQGRTPSPLPPLGDIRVTTDTMAAKDPVNRPVGAWTILRWVLGFLGGVALGLLVVYIPAYFNLMNSASSAAHPICHQSKISIVNSDSPYQTDTCVLPPSPEHGFYILSDAPNAIPGQSFESFMLTVNCVTDYRTLGAERVFCSKGIWSHPLPKCIRYCKLPATPSVRYQCLDPGFDQCFRECNTHVPSGTVVKPECNRPYFYSSDSLPYMKCVDGSWDHVVDCSPECGRISRNLALIFDARSAKHGELPWHVSIYLKTSRPYKQICGGSLVRNRAVLSAAHCFWDDITKQQDASMYAVAAGKIYRPWNNSRDKFAQYSNVKEIKIPARFQGSAANYQDDIAVLILEVEFEYTPYVRPICMDFNSEFEKSQLQPNNSGMVGGSGIMSENGTASQILKIAELPYVEIKQCIELSPYEYRECITSDKICAGYVNGSTSLAKGDSGGGLAFRDSGRGSPRYFLRGVASTAPINGNLSDNFHRSLTAFTLISKHEHFIKASLLCLD